PCPTRRSSELRMDSETVNGAGSVSFGWDDGGLLTGAGGLTIARDPQNGRVTGGSVGVITDTIGHDAFGAEESRTVTVSGATVFSVTTVPDALGRISERTETIQGVTHVFGYAYDPAGRLMDVYEDGVLIAHYDHDANGNREGRTTANGTISGAYDDQDRLLSHGAVTYAYLDSGELWSRMDTATGA